ncbi:MAG: ChrR family anti-sigma-E factor [Hyphomicrobiaceae bacterium]
MSHSIKHHPDGATLVSYAAATLAEPLAAVVACHIAMCPSCRSEIADLERVGAALLFSLDGQPTENALEPLQRADRQYPQATPSSARSSDRLPSPLVAVYGLKMDSIAWRRLGPGVWHHRLALRQRGAGDLRLLRIAAGRRMPNHGHGGAELTLMLEGSYSDSTGNYRRGDVQDLDEHVEHQPVVSADAECICLIASERPARFKSFVGRITQPWTGL